MIARRLLPWFWPQIAEARLWVNTDKDSKFPPGAYVRDEPRPLLTHLMSVTPPSWSVLDLGCNAGSDLNILYRNGYRNLLGVDAGIGALQTFSDLYPQVFAECDIEHDTFQRYLSRRPSASIDVIHSHGATLELVHPSFPIVAEICRVARKSIHVCILEEGHSYPRLWVRQFERSGFRLDYAERGDDRAVDHSLLHFVRVKSLS